MAIRRNHEGNPEMNTLPNIVLVHGAWADGSCWSGVIERLQAGGYHVTAPQFPLTALADDVARLRQVLDLQDGPTIVAGHSYGGQVMTALGADAPNVASLVYIAAFGLDQGESLGGLLSQGPVTPALAHLFTDTRGFGWLSEDDFVNHFAGDVDPGQGQGDVRRATAAGRVRLHRRDGRPGLENAAVLVPGRGRRRGAPARCRAAVRRPHGRHHHRDPLQPRPDGLPPRRRGPAHRDGRRSRPGHELDRRTRSRHAPIWTDKRPTDISVAGGKEHMMKGAHNDERVNADLSGLRGADHRAGGHGRPAWPEPLNL